MANTNYRPEGYNTITPGLTFKDTKKAIEWYKKVFGTSEKTRMENPDKKIVHTELVIGDSTFFLADEDPQMNNKTPQSTRGNSINLYIYVSDVDATFKKAEDNNAKSLMPPRDMFYGDRVAKIEDPFGYEWTVATHIKDVTDEEVSKGMKEMATQPA